MPALESFLTIEFSLARRLEVARRETMQSAAEEIVGAAKKDRYDIAHDLVNQKISFEPMLDKVGHIFEAFGLSAFILGAATARDGDVTATNVMRSGEIPPPVSIGIGALRSQFSDSGRMVNTYRERIHNELRKLERESREADDAAVDNDESDFVSIFGADIATEAARLNAAVASGKTYVDIGANLTTSRLTSYGFLSESSSAGVTKFQRTAVLDNRTCEFCRGLHGRIFDVPNALAQLQNQLLQMAEGPDALAGSPFPAASTSQLQDGMEREQLESQGIHLPPSHPLCRCTLVRVGNVPAKEIFNPGGSLITAPKGARELASSIRKPGRHLTRVSAPQLDDAAAELAVATGLSEAEVFGLLEEEALERSERGILGTLLGGEGETL